MRISGLYLIFCLIFWAVVASAEPDCDDSGLTQTRGLASYQAPEVSNAVSEDENEVTRPGKDSASLQQRELSPCKLRAREAAGDRMRERGAVCGDWTIVGEDRPTFKGKNPACGIAEPVRIRSVSDILLSQLSLMDCGTAVRLKTWLENTAKPVFADRGGGLKGLRIVGHYACKTQNNQPGGRMSEHARGRAIDISSFILMDGTVITVEEGWANAETNALMRELHAGACGLFGTVLGPEADRFHQGHFHFDTARRHSGSYCR